jgi:regulator of cell morphogenesis and NO signaling
MSSHAEKTLAEIATENHRTVKVFEKYGLDFCCRGKKKLQEACKEKGLDVAIVSKEISLACAFGQDSEIPFYEMSILQLISHIVARHHYYVKMSMPLIGTHLDKVAGKHGDSYPYMREVLDLFSAVQEEMIPHMQKEENILFPRIIAWNQNSTVEPVPDYVSAPISVMEKDHEHVSELMYKIRELTNQYTPPVNACTTFRVSLQELKDFEADLHQHVHLENNILFPRVNSSRLN